MTNDQLDDALRNTKSVVVHFSHHACMRENGVFPYDLQDAINNRDQWNLSCCLLWPGHQMNLPGSVGVIFSPLAQHVVSVSSDDSGSTTTANGEEISAGVDLTQESFDGSLSVEPGRYNEWRLNGADVYGIFVSNPAGIYAKNKVKLSLPMGDEEIIKFVPISLELVKQSFPGYRVYTMDSNGLIEI